MNTRKSLYDIKSFYDKKAVLKASFGGMRYQAEQVAADGEKHLRLSVWPEPFCFEKTAEEKIQMRLFPIQRKDWMRDTSGCVKNMKQKKNGGNMPGIFL